MIASVRASLQMEMGVSQAHTSVARCTMGRPRRRKAELMGPEREKAQTLTTRRAARRRDAMMERRTVGKTTGGSSRIRVGVWWNVERLSSRLGEAPEVQSRDVLGEAQTRQWYQTLSEWLGSGGCL